MKNARNAKADATGSRGVQPLRPSTIAAIRDLIAANLDSSRELETAAAAIQDTGVARLLREIAVQRGEHVIELQNALTIRKIEANFAGTLTGTLRRLWLELRAAVQGGDPYAVLVETERAEDVIKKAYEAAVRECDDNPISVLLQAQFATVERGHDRVRELRDQAKLARG